MNRQSKKKRNLVDLPSPPEGKTGWPWTEETDINLFRDGIDYPKISIVTPSYNQGHYIEETIRSVLLQNYPNLEFIIIDGGSTDNTVEIIKKYEPWISYWVSEKDRGQSHALNKGFEKASGDWIGWQNSDDIYYKNSFRYLLSSVIKHPHKDIHFGKIYQFDDNYRIINELHFVPFSLFVLKYKNMNISNQATFFSKKVIQEQKIDNSYFFAMDFEYFMRLAFKGYKFSFINHFLAGFRIQINSKTENFNNISILETNKIRRKYGIKVKDGISWKQQFLFQKFISLIYLFPFKMFYGGAFYFIKKAVLLNKRV